MVTRIARTAEADRACASVTATSVAAPLDQSVSMDRPETLALLLTVTRTHVETVTVFAPALANSLAIPLDDQQAVSHVSAVAFANPSEASIVTAALTGSEWVT